MATAGDEIALSKSVGAGEKFRNSSGILDQGETATTGISELEQTLKQMTYTGFKIQHPKTMENLPDEILSNIFFRLLAKQLAQMRSVSKSWNALLSHSFFVKSHIHRSICNNNNQVLLVFPEYHGRHRLFEQYSCESPHLEPTNFIKHIPTNLPMSWVIGAVNGLICLSELFYSNIHIWNPSLSAVLTLPPPHSMPTTLNYETSIRFGFDPKTDDYKLVKVTGLRDTSGAYASVKRWLEVEVYSLRKGSWEFVTQPVPSHIKKVSNTDYLCVDGHHGYLHWLIETGVKTEDKILAFDLGSETFREMPFPDSIINSNHEWHVLGVLGGKLCVILWRTDDVYEVCVMEEYGVPESWTKRLVFSQFTVGGFTYGFTSRNELLLEDEEGRLLLYDPIANNTKSAHKGLIAMGIVEYRDSLVWIKTLKKFN